MKLALGVPAYAHIIDDGQFPMWVALGVACAERGVPIVSAEPYSYCHVDESRNVLTQGALAAGADVLLMVDADVYVEPEAAPGLVALAALCERPEVAMAGAAVPRRELGTPNVYRIEDGATRFCSWEALAGRISQVDCVGAALVAISLDWLRTHWPEPPWFSTHRIPDAEGVLHLVGEDAIFSTMVRQEGGLILCDGGLVPRHMADRAVDALGRPRRKSG